MSATPARAATTLALTSAQYEVLSLSPPPIPTQAELFDHQVGFWASNGLGIEDELRRLAEFVPENGIFVMVPRRPDALDLDRLMSLVVLNGRTGANYLNPTYLKDEVEVPKGPYLMLGIEDGRARLNTAPKTSHKKIVSEGRSPYTAFEGIAHGALFPVVLEHHNMDLPGSRYDRAGSVPNLCLSDGEPGLGWSDADDADPKWGAASCGSRKGLGN